MFAISSSFVIIFVWTGSSLYRHVTSISLCLSVTKPHIFRNNTVLNYTSNNQRYIPVHLVASELRLAICCLFPAMHAISRCNSVSSFSHTGKITTFQKLKSKFDELTVCDQLRPIPLTLFRKSVCCHFSSICISRSE